LNASPDDARVKLTVYFEDQEPVGPFELAVPAKWTRHVRLNDFNQRMQIPKDTSFASVIESKIPIVVQHTRLDSRQAENALLSTIAFAATK
jgi:hypothetical protein